MIDEPLGFVNILKPTGMTSSDVVLKVKKIFGTKRVGHLGTLDPAASGVLPIAIGKATKFFDYFLSKNKTYIARVTFGVETETLDSFGNITKISNCDITKNQIESAIKSFIGEIYQTPPKYSAVKINGKKAYELARENKNFDIKSRKITIFGIKIKEKCENNTFLFEVDCSAGTYIRTLFSDIAKALGTVSTTTAIIRTKSGSFDINSSVTLENLEKEKNIISVEKVFEFLPKVELTQNVAKKVLNGVNVKNQDLGLSQDFSGEFLLEFERKIVGIYNSQNDIVKPKVFIF